MAYRIQVCLDKGTKTERWADMRPTGGTHYEFDTRGEAEKMAYICYGSDPSVVRVYETNE